MKKYVNETYITGCAVAQALC